MWAHDEHDAEGMHFLSNVADATLYAKTGTSLEEQVLLCAKKSANLQTIKQVGFRGQRQTYITELDHPDLSQFTDATVGRFWLEEELSQRHLFTSEEFPHVAEGRERSAPQNP